MAKDSSTVVEHLPHHPKVEGLNPPPAIAIMGENMANGSSTVAEHLPPHPKVEGLSPATIVETMREVVAIANNKVVEHCLIIVWSRVLLNPPRLAARETNWQMTLAQW